MKTLLSSSFVAKASAVSAFTALSFLAVAPAQAAIFNVNGTNYDITTVTGTYSSLSAQLSATPWFNFGSDVATNSQKTLDLASAVGNTFGLPNTLNLSGGVGPLFYNQVMGMGIGIYELSPGLGVYGSVYSSNPGVRTYAVVSSAVPEPLTILGAMTAAGFGAGFKRKLAKSKKSQDDTSV
jgi:hypothetical protein